MLFCFPFFFPGLKILLCFCRGGFCGPSFHCGEAIFFCFSTALFSSPAFLQKFSLPPGWFLMKILPIHQVELLFSLGADANRLRKAVWMFAGVSGKAQSTAEAVTKRKRDPHSPTVPAAQVNSDGFVLFPFPAFFPFLFSQNSLLSRWADSACGEGKHFQRTEQPEGQHDFGWPYRECFGFTHQEAREMLDDDGRAVKMDEVCCWHVPPKIPPLPQ